MPFGIQLSNKSIGDISTENDILQAQNKLRMIQDRIDAATLIEKQLNDNLKVVEFIEIEPLLEKEKVIKDNIKKLNEQFEEDKQKFSVRIKERTGILDILISREKELQDNINKLNDELSSMDEESEGFKDKFNKDISKKQGNLSTLEETILLKEVYLKRLNKDLSTTLEEVTDITKKRDNLFKEYNNLVDQYNNKEKEFNGKVSDIEGLKKEESELLSR